MWPHPTGRVGDCDEQMTIIRFQLLVHQLLQVHYGITLSDTGLSDDAEVSRMIELGKDIVAGMVGWSTVCG